MQVKSTIIVECVPMLQAELDKLNKKAVKLGCKPLTVTLSAPYFRIIGPNELDEAVDVIIDGEPIKLNGWRFLGRVEAVPNEDNLIFTVPGEKAPDSYRKSSPYLCQHCGQNRVRKATWLVQHDNGDLKQVGSSCMDDFLNAKNPERAIAWWMSSLEKLVKYLQDLESKKSHHVTTGIYQSSEPFMISAIDVLCRACQIVRTRNKYEFDNVEQGIEGTPTHVWHSIFGTNPAEPLTQADNDLADNVVAYVLARRYTADYFTNLAIMLIAEKVQATNVRYIVSAVYSFLKEHDQLPGRQAKLSEHVGTVGERLRDLKLTVTYVHLLLSEYHENYDYLIMMQDEAGRVYKWKKTTAGMLEKGEQVLLTGTVKAHEIYKGTKQTMLTRCAAKVIA